MSTLFLNQINECVVFILLTTFDAVKNDVDSKGLFGFVFGCNFSFSVFQKQFTKSVGFCKTIMILYDE